MPPCACGSEALVPGSSHSTHEAITPRKWRIQICFVKSLSQLSPHSRLPLPLSPPLRLVVMVATVADTACTVAVIGVAVIGTVLWLLCKFGVFCLGSHT